MRRIKCKQPRKIVLVEGVTGTGKTLYCFNRYKAFLPEVLPNKIRLLSKWARDLISGDYDGVTPLYSSDHLFTIVEKWLREWKHTKILALDRYPCKDRDKELSIIRGILNRIFSKYVIEIHYIYTDIEKAYKNNRYQKSNFTEEEYLQKYIPQSLYESRLYASLLDKGLIDKLTYVHRCEDNGYTFHNDDIHFQECVNRIIEERDYL